MTENIVFSNTSCFIQDLWPKKSVKRKKEKKISIEEENKRQEAAWREREEADEQ